MKSFTALLSIIFLFPFISNSQNVDTVYFTGSSQTFVITSLMASGPITFDVRGAQGGDLLPGFGGYGGQVITDLNLSVGDVLTINVGQKGIDAIGYSGGVFVGSGGTSSNLGSAGGVAGTGGGATDIRLNSTALNDRIIVAGGGGGCGGVLNASLNSWSGGLGGGLIGGTGTNAASFTNGGGQGGTQSAGGAVGTSGGGFCSGSATAGSLGIGGIGSGDMIGGGGGYYGGGGACFSGGGGGSSYTDPSASNTIHNQGSQEGNGMVIITSASCFTPNQSITVCDSLISPSGNHTWTTSGIKYDTISTLFGCADTLVSIDLTVINSLESFIPYDACSFYIWPENGGVYTSSGQYSVMYQSAEGCDSTITLDLNIVTPLNVSDSVEVCETYTWPVNGQVYTSSTNQTLTTGGTTGCDTTYSLNLIVHNPTSDTESMIACDSYTWPVTGMTYSTSGQITETLTTIGGCDSIRILDLTINNVDASATDIGNNSLSANSIGANYQWLDCDNNYAIITGDTNQVFNVSGTGSFAVEVTGNGCVDTSDCFTYTLDIQDNNISSVEIYPNPIIQSVNVDLGQKYKSINIRISDISGKRIESYQFDNKQFFKLDLEGEAGLYFIEITTESGMKSTTIVVKE